MQYRILNTIGEAFDPKAKDILNRLGKVDYKTPSQKELLEKIGDYDLVLCGLGLVFSAEVLKKASRLKMLATATTGLDHIDLTAAEERGIKILSLKGEEDFLNTISGTAELALGILLSLARNIPQATAAVLKGEWNREAFKGHSLYGATLGVVGLGRLGRMMARYGEVLGMSVIFTDPNVQSSHPSWKKVSFDDLLKESDYISIHVHLSPETEFLFDHSVLQKMKKSAYLINTSRGKIVHEQDIANALEEGNLAGYGADVLDEETAFIAGDCRDHPLVAYARKHSNVLILPHIGGMTFESRRDTDIFMAHKLSKSLSP